jgi:hypothetical protein
LLRVPREHDRGVRYADARSCGYVPRRPWGGRVHVSRSTRGGGWLSREHIADRPWPQLHPQPSSEWTDVGVLVRDREMFEAPPAGGFLLSAASRLVQTGHGAHEHRERIDQEVGLRLLTATRWGGQGEQSRGGTEIGSRSRPPWDATVGEARGAVVRVGSTAALSVRQPIGAVGRGCPTLRPSRLPTRSRRLPRVCQRGDPIPVGFSSVLPTR